MGQRSSGNLTARHATLVIPRGNTCRSSPAPAWGCLALNFTRYQIRMEYEEHLFFCHCRPAAGVDTTTQHITGHLQSSSPGHVARRASRASRPAGPLLWACPPPRRVTSRVGSLPQLPPAQLDPNPPRPPTPTSFITRQFPKGRPNNERVH